MFLPDRERNDEHKTSRRHQTPNHGHHDAFSRLLWLKVPCTHQNWNDKLVGVGCKWRCSLTYKHRKWIVSNWSLNSWHRVFLSWFFLAILIVITNSESIPTLLFWKVCSQSKRLHATGLYTETEWLNNLRLKLENSPKGNFSLLSKGIVGRQIIGHNQNCVQINIILKTNSDDRIYKNVSPHLSEL